MAASQPANFNLQEFTDAGQLLVGGRLYTYAYGTTAHKTAFTDPEGSVPHTYTLDGAGGQYIALNVRGELPAPLYLSDGSYDISLKRADGSMAWTRRASGVEAPVRSLSEALASSPGASLVGFMPAGVGAVSRLLQDKLRETVSVIDFGASPSKTAAQNAACVQKAINSLGAGGSVLFPDADWPMDTVYVQNDRVTLRGQGDATIITPGNSDGIVVGLEAAALSFCKVLNLRFDRVAKSSSGAAVKIVNTAYSEISGCGFRNSHKGVHVKGHNDSLKIRKNTFYDGTYYGIYEYNQNEPWSNDLRISKNDFWHVEFAALYMSADGVGVASVGDTYFHHNTINSSPSKGALQTQHAVRVEGAGTYNTNIRVEHNIMEGLSKQFVYMTGVNRCPVKDNYFSGTGINDVGLYYGGGIGNSQIAGNTFIGFNSAGAFIFSTGGITLTANHFTANVTLGGAVAELTMQNVSDVVVNGNFFSCASSKWAIDVTQNGAAVDNIVYSGNRFSKSGGNSNYQYDIRHNNYGSGKRMTGNVGNDATSGEASGPPVAGMALQWYPGDFIKNNSAAELGNPGSKYLITGWTNVAQGDPGLFRECRVLTGN